MSQPGLEPVAASARVHAIDAVRGFALLGIFLVNIQTFGEAFGEFVRPTLREGMPAGDVAAFYFVKIFCEGKFYPLFSMLFGMGLMLQWQRAQGAGRRFLGTGLRRLLVLGIIGLCHAFLLWYGDILFMYSTAGVVLLLLTRARVRTLVTVAASLLFVATVLSMGWAALTTGRASEATAAVATKAPGGREGEEVAEPKPPFERFIRSPPSSGLSGR
jgi:uncharacterized protein